MQWIFLIGDEAFTLKSFSKMHFKDSRKKIISDDQLEVRYDNNDYVVLYKEEKTNDMKNEFEPSAFEEYMLKLPFDDPRWIMVRYSNISVLRSLLSEKGFPTDVMIDCDGVRLELEDIVDESRII